MERALRFSVNAQLQSLGEARLVRILLAMITVGGTSCAVKLIALIKGSIVARQFGVSPDLDAFYVAYLLPSFLGDLLAGAVVVALVPLYIRTHEQKGSVAAQSFTGHVLIVTTICSLALATLNWVLWPNLIGILGETFHQDQVRLTSSLFLLLIPALPLTVISAIFTSVLTARNRLGLATLAPGIGIAVVTVAIYCFSSQWGIYSFAVGTTLGIAAQTVALAVTLKFLDLQPRIGWGGLAPTIRSFLTQIMIVVAGSAVINLIDVIDQYSAAMIGPGKLSALNYGNKIVLSVLGPASLAVSTAALPPLSELVCRGDFGPARRILKTFSMVILAVTVPLTLLLVICSPLIVAVLFQRSAFTSYDTLQVTAVQRFFLLQIPLHVLGMLFVSLIWSFRANWVFLVINPICLLLKIYLNSILTTIYGVPGIGLASSITYGVSCVLLILAGTWLMRREERVRKTYSQ